MTETPKLVSTEAPTGARPPIKWVITVKETDSTVVVQFPVKQIDSPTDQNMNENIKEEN